MISRGAVAPVQRTGWVRVTMIDDSVRIVPAPSFGDAASQIHCSPAQIKRFEWVQP